MKLISKIRSLLIDPLKNIQHKIQHKIKINRLKIQNIGLNSYVDPSVQVLGWENVKIGENSCIGEDVLININLREKGKLGLSIGNNCYIGRRSFFTTGDLIRIKDYCLIAMDNQFLGSDHIYESPFLPFITTGFSRGIIEVGVNCWLSASVTVLKGVTIGYGSIIGARTVVNKNIPPFSVVVGNPCRIVKRFDVQGNKWVRVDQYPEDGDRYLPSEGEYLEKLKQNYPKINMPIIANTKLLGDL